MHIKSNKLKGFLEMYIENALTLVNKQLPPKSKNHIAITVSPKEDNLDVKIKITSTSKTIITPITVDSFHTYSLDEKKKVDANPIYDDIQKDIVDALIVKVNNKLNELAVV